ncbi:MAG TPA: HAD-IB family hydrolase [Pseudonocardiaceae bacterium]|jgi:HAD superfamily hydrolase (TIGR01490 family)|nr:HAD-IB family hydrolase [Pseudonocardiaceae bacterium]
MSRTTEPIRAAFFDVDETLITIKSMFRFLAHHFAALGSPPSRYEQAAGLLHSRAAAGVPRAETNRTYYEFFLGQPVDKVAEHGREWFAEELAAGGLFHEPAVRAFTEHRDARDLTVLVSGSFSACLAPIAEHLGADLALGTEPEAEHGHYTGRTGTPMIGSEKGAAAVRTLASWRLSPADAYAYADHASDLGLLRAVAHPVVVGEDPMLLEHAAQHGWARLPGIDRASSTSAKRG